MDAGSGRKARSAINVTPLIDIVLVLLIVFIVMVPGLTRTLLVAVPRAVAAPVPARPDPANPPVVISVRRPPGGSYEYLLQSDPVRLPELADRLTPVVLRQVPGLRKVYLKIDGEAPFQVAVDVLDQVRLASDRAKEASRAKGGPDGGDVKVAISLRKDS
jgi:biopolymer transport protein ExbD